MGHGADIDAGQSPISSPGSRPGSRHRRREGMAPLGMGCALWYPGVWGAMAGEGLSCSLVPGKARLKDGAEREVWLGGSRDRGLLLDMYRRLSEDTVLLRFLRPVKYWEPVVDEILENARIILVAGSYGLEAVASAEAYDTGIRGVAELGIVVRDDLQGKGLGTVLTALLGLCLLENGYKAMEAYFDPFNIPMKRIIVDKLGGRVVGQGRDMVFTRLDLEPNRERMLRVLEGRYTPAHGGASPA